MGGLIASALAGGLAGGGAAAERAFSRLGETQARMDLEQVRGEIDRQRAEALVRLQSEARRGDARFASDLQLEVADRERGRVRGIIGTATSAALDDGPATPAMIRQRVRGDLAASGDLRAAADYDKATESDRPTVVSTPFGYKSTVLDRDGNVLREVDNASEIRAENDRLRAQRTGTRPAKEITQEDAFKLSEQASKQAERLVKARPHPFPDPLSTDKDANRDLAFQRAAEGLYRETLSDALASGVVVAPDRIDRLVLAVHDKAKGAIVAEANEQAGKLFDAKGRPNTGADAALAKLGIRANSRDEFVRAYYDSNIERAMNDVINASRQARAGQSGGQASVSVGASRSAQTAAQEPAVTDGERPDDADRLARRPTGLIGGAATSNAPVSTIADPDVALVEREQREMEAGARRDFSPAAKAVLERMDAEKRRRNDAMRTRMQQQDLDRSRAAARAARGD